MNATILYYSSGKENKKLESEVQKNIMKVKGDLPIVCVSQFPIDFGDIRIVVGDVGASGFNMFRQVQIGLKKVTTPFVVSAESDCLYPPDYFTWIPRFTDTCYRNSNLYVMPDHRYFFFHKKEGATHAQIIGTKFYLNRLNYLFKNAPEWSVEEKNFPKERHKQDDIFSSIEIEHYETKNPVVQIKTHLGMRYYTHSDRTPINKIKYWGNGIEFRKRYYK